MEYHGIKAWREENNASKQRGNWAKMHRETVREVRGQVRKAKALMELNGKEGLDGLTCMRRLETVFHQEMGNPQSGQHNPTIREVIRDPVASG